MAFAHPALLLALLGVVPLVLLLESRGDGSRRRRFLRATLRTALLALLVLTLAEPETPRSTARERRLVVAIEQSSTMGEAGRREADDLGREAADAAMAARIPVTVLAFDATAGRASNLAAAWTPPLPLDGAGPARPAAGLAAARLAFGPGEDGTILLLASGHGDLTQLAAEASAARASGVTIRAHALPREAPPAPRAGPRISAFDLPPRVRSPFDLKARVAARMPADVEVLVDGQGVLRQHLEATSEAGDDARPRDILLPDVPAAPGPREITLQLRDAIGETTLERRLVIVEAPPRVLLIEDAAEPHGAGSALQAQGYQVLTLPAPGLARALEPGATSFDALLLDSTAAAALPPDAQAALVERIEAGLGLVLLAGEESESWARLAEGGLAAALPLQPLPPPVEEEPLPPIPPPITEPDPVESPDPTPDPGLRAERRPEEALPISLLLVIDRSGSMVGPKLGMAIEGARRAARTLSQHDRVGIITFADDATLDVPMAPARRLGILGMRLAGLKAHGNTDIYGALVKARDVLQKEDAPIRHLIVLTDGQQTARRAVFSHLIESLGREGITVTAVGLGYSHDETLLKSIAMWAPRGRYVPADSEAQLPTIMTRDTQIIAEARQREAEAMARIQDKNRPPPEEEPKPEPDATPRPPSGEETPPPTDPVPSEPTESLVALQLVRPHEATAGLDRAALPAVGGVRGSLPRPGAALLMTRGDDEVALAATRRGLGRIMMWTLPPDAEGLDAWPDLGTFFVDVTRSVLAPAGSLSTLPFASVVHGPDTERLRLEAEPGATPPALQVVWMGEDRRVDLGLVLPGGEEDLELPALPRGARGQIHFIQPDTTAPALPPLTYLGRGRVPEPPRAGDAEALAKTLGREALAEAAPLFAPPIPRPAPRPLWPYFLVAAILLLPLDVWLHRRPGTPA